MKSCGIVNLHLQVPTKRATRLIEVAHQQKQISAGGKVSGDSLYFIKTLSDCNVQDHRGRHSGPANK